MHIWSSALHGKAALKQRLCVLSRPWLKCRAVRRRGHMLDGLTATVLPQRFLED